MNEKEPLGVPAGGGGSDGHGPGAFASPPSGPAGEGEALAKNLAKKLKEDASCPEK